MTATAQTKVKPLRCSAHYVTVNHLRININGTLSRTRNVSCKTAKVMAHYAGTHPVGDPSNNPFKLRGHWWETQIRRPRGTWAQPSTSSTPITGSSHHPGQPAGELIPVLNPGRPHSSHDPRRVDPLVRSGLFRREGSITESAIAFIADLTEDGRVLSRGRDRDVVGGRTMPLPRSRSPEAPTAWRSLFWRAIAPTDHGPAMPMATKELSASPVATPVWLGSHFGSG
jgi:hypothetical protein